MAAVSSTNTPHLPDLLNRCEKVVTHFDSLLLADQVFRKRIAALKLTYPEGYVEHISEFSAAIWIEPSRHRYIFFLDLPIARSHSYFIGIDLNTKQIVAVHITRETHSPDYLSTSDAMYNEITTRQIGPKTLAYHSESESTRAADLVLTHSYLVQEKYDADLPHFLYQNTTHPHPKALFDFFAVQCIAEVAQLHKKGLIHRNLILSYFLIRKKEDRAGHEIKLTGFQSARDPGTSEHLRGTSYIIPPESLVQKLISQPVSVTEHQDAWSLSISLLLMQQLCGVGKPISFLNCVDKERVVIYESILSLMSNPNWAFEQEPEDPVDAAIFHLSQVDPKKRWTVQQAYEALLPIEATFEALTPPLRFL